MNNFLLLRFVLSKQKFSLNGKQDDHITSCKGGDAKSRIIIHPSLDVYYGIGLGIPNSSMRYNFLVSDACTV